MILGHQTKRIAVERSEGAAGSWPASHRPHAAGDKRPEASSRACIRRTTHEKYCDHRAVLLSIQVVTRLEMTP